MSDNISLRKLEEDAGKPARTKHGIRAYMTTGKLPSGRAWKRCQAEIVKLRADLIRQYGGEAIRPDVAAMIESAIEGLTIQRLASLYVRKAGILRRDSLKEGNLELHSILSGQFVSYANLVRLNLEAAARLAGQKGPEPIPTIAEVIREIDAGKAQEASALPAEGPRSALGEETGAGQGAGQGEGA